MTEEALQAFGEACVAEAAPEIVKEATIELRVEKAGLEAESAELRRQRDKAENDKAAADLWARISGWIAAAGTLAGALLGIWVSSLIR